jgi:glutamine synthetase
MSGEILDREALDGLIKSGDVDTVILAFPDQQGRLLGKRLTGRHFREHVADHGVHACDYLLTVDLEMEPLPGYEVASWERGYGDFVVVPDWTTALQLPWLPDREPAPGRRRQPLPGVCRHDRRRSPLEGS